MFDDADGMEVAGGFLIRGSCRRKQNGFIFQVIRDISVLLCDELVTFLGHLLALKPSLYVRGGSKISIPSQC